MFVKDLYHKTTPPDANQHGVVRAVLGKARFFFRVASAKGCRVGILKEVRQNYSI